MAATVPTSVPSTIRAGDTAKWTISLSDYPAGTWTLSYSLAPFWSPSGSGGGSVVTFSATADGNTHEIEVDADDTLGWTAGKYAYQATVTDGTERYTVGIGELEVLPDLATAGQIDPRSKARRILDFLERTMENWSQKQVSRATIEGVAFEFRTWADLEKAWAFWAAITSTEEQAATGGSRRIILAQFTSPQ